MWSKHVLNNVGRDFFTYNIITCNGGTEEFLTSIFLKKNSIRLDINVAMTNADKGSPMFLHMLFDRYLDQMLMKYEQNRVIRNIQLI